MPRLIDHLILDTSESIVYNDVNFEAYAFKQGVSSPDLIDILGTTGILGYGFNGNMTMEQLYSGGEILHDYKEGTDLLPHVHWMPTTTNTGNVEWHMAYSIQNTEGSGTAVFPAPTTISGVGGTTGTAWLSKIAALGDIDGTDIKIGAHILFRFYRNPAGANDTYPDDAVVLSVGLHYQVNTLGSREVYTK